MDLLEAAQALASIGAGLNRSTENAGKIAAMIEDERESLVNMAARAQEVTEYMPAAIAADVEFGFGNAEALSSCLEKTEELVGFIVAAMTEQEEAQLQSTQMAESSKCGEDAIEDALTALNSVTPG
jgi:hypothetical protein